jgi:hypothetical protein
MEAEDGRRFGDTVFVSIAETRTDAGHTKPAFPLPSYTRASPALSSYFKLTFPAHENDFKTRLDKNDPAQSCWLPTTTVRRVSYTLNQGPRHSLLACVSNDLIRIELHVPGLVQAQGNLVSKLFGVGGIPRTEKRIMKTDRGCLS